AATDRFATALRADGIGPGRRVALDLPNHPVHPIAFFGALKAGAAVVQVSPLYIENDLVDLLKDARPDAIVTLDFLYPNLRHVEARVSIPRIYVAQMRSFLPWWKRPFVNRVLRRRGLHPIVPKGPGIRSFEQALRTPARALPAIETDPSEEVAVLQYTGGTTGLPKAARLSHRNLVANAYQCRAWFGIQPPGIAVVLAAIPFFHVYGMTVALTYPLLEGATIVLETRPDPVEIMGLVDRYRPTELPGVPALYAALCNHPKIGEHDFRSIRVCVSGSAPLPKEVAERFERLSGGYLIEGYGLTEASPVTHANPIQGDRRTGSIGLPLPETDHRIVDAETGTRELPVGEVGELAVRGPQVMGGYDGRPEESAQVLRDGWLLTGDLARVDAEGYAYIVDRKKDLIDVGGFKVYPREVEEELFRHPAIGDAAVTGVSDPILGEIVVAFVVLKPERTLSEAEIVQFIRERIAHYKAPRRVFFRTSLPRTAALKVLRRTLRREVEQASAAGPAAGARVPGR
ncbi:MAG: long-chain fatty acid--CoA ligase, partial [Thermoplasmata archaeon]|nr:long-chain fatty acid--CoA ligase [Thermoplasmata archaeon]